MRLFWRLLLQVTSLRSHMKTFEEKLEMRLFCGRMMKTRMRRMSRKKRRKKRAIEKSIHQRKKISVAVTLQQKSVKCAKRLWFQGTACMRLFWSLLLQVTSLRSHMKTFEEKLEMRLFCGRMMKTRMRRMSRKKRRKKRAKEKSIHQRKKISVEVTLQQKSVKCAKRLWFQGAARMRLFWRLLLQVTSLRSHMETFEEKLEMRLFCGRMMKTRMRRMSRKKR